MQSDPLMLQTRCCAQTLGLDVRRVHMSSEGSLATNAESIRVASAHCFSSLVTSLPVCARSVLDVYRTTGKRVVLFCHSKVTFSDSSGSFVACRALLTRLQRYLGIARNSFRLYVG